MMNMHNKNNRLIATIVVVLLVMAMVLPVVAAVLR